MTDNVLSPRRNPMMKKSAARLAAVQVLFQLDLYPETRHDDPAADSSDENSDIIRLVESAIRDLLTQLQDNTTEQDEEGLDIDPDPKYLNQLACGTAAHLAEIDPLIIRHLSKDWKFDRLDPVLRAVLRCAAYELLHMPSVPTKVIINEYVDVTGAFSEKLETGFINGIVEAMAMAVRPG